MISLQNVVIEKFLQRIAAHENFDDVKVEQLRTLVEAKKKINVDDLIEVYRLPEGGEFCDQN